MSLIKLSSSSFDDQNPPCGTIAESIFFKKMGQPRPLFVYFRSLKQQFFLQN